MFEDAPRISVTDSAGLTYELSSVPAAVRGLRAQMAGVYSTVIPRRMIATIFNLPPPSDQLWRTNRLQAAGFKDPATLEENLRASVRSFVTTHARVEKAGPPGLDGYWVVQLPASGYVLSYPMTADAFEEAMHYGIECRNCGYEWAAHANEFCPAHLGVRFKSAEEHYENAYSIVKFHNQLPGWLSTQADAIYKSALEGAVT